MFINPSKFEKALKRAYESTGITAIRTEETLAVDAGEWCCEMKISRMPKEIHAAMVKIIGWLPMEGEAYKYIKGQPEQMAMAETVRVANKLIQRTGSRMAVYETPVIMKIPGGDEWRVMQTEMGFCFAMPERTKAMIDMGKLNEGESMPEPYAFRSEVIWANEEMTMVAEAYKGAGESRGGELLRAMEMSATRFDRKLWIDQGWERL